MNKKHFEAIAKEINNTLKEIWNDNIFINESDYQKASNKSKGVEWTIENLIGSFESNYPLFNTYKFNRACFDNIELGWNKESHWTI